MKQKIAAANRQPIDIMGAVFLSVEASLLTTNLMTFLTPDVHGLYLSWQVLTELYVILMSFLTEGDAKLRAGEEETAPTVAAVADRTPCGCLPRQSPPL